MLKQSIKRKHFFLNKNLRRLWIFICSELFLHSFEPKQILLGCLTQQLKRISFFFSEVTVCLSLTKNQTLRNRIYFQTFCCFLYFHHDQWFCGFVVWFDMLHHGSMRMAKTHTKMFEMTALVLCMIFLLDILFLHWKILKCFLSYSVLNLFVFTQYIKEVLVSYSFA